MCKSEVFDRALEAVARQTEVDPERIIGKGREMEEVDARCILFRVLRDQGLYTSQIARKVHKTPQAIRYLLSKLDDRIEANKMVKTYLEEASKQLANNSQTTGK